MDTNTGEHYASLLSCKLGKLPFQYLGQALHWKKPSKSDWLRLIDKIKAKLPSFLER